MAQNTILLRLLEEDRIEVPQSGGSERMVKCWIHEERTPSMSVNVTTGVYYCFGCGATGNTYTYLQERRNMDNAEAVQYLVDQGEWPKEKAEQAYTKSNTLKEDRQHKREGLPNWVEKYPNELKAHGGYSRLIKEYPYITADGELVSMVLRYGSLNPDGTPTKDIRQYTPRSQGGWWCVGALNKDIPAEDRKIDRFPLYRLPELLAGGPDEVVWFVEGEKCVDCVIDTPRPSGKKNPLSTSIIGGGAQRNLDKHDLAPLYGRRVFLIADADDSGRKFMAMVGEHLRVHGSSVMYALPPGETKYDVADAMGEGGWESVGAWMKEIGFVEYPPGVGPINVGTFIDDETGEVTTNKEAPVGISDTDYFRVLGLDQSGTIISIMNKRTQSIISRNAASIDAAGTLLLLAPLEFWEKVSERTGSFGQQNTRLRIADALIRAAEEAGIMDPNSPPKGRGGIKTPNNTLVYNVGAEALTVGEDGLLNQKCALEDAPALLEPGSPIKIVTPSSNARGYGKRLAELLSRCRFETEIDAARYCGWIVTSLIGGMLDFRPMVWITAPSQTGKTILTSEILTRIFGNTVVYSSDPTAAGISQRCRSDSLPIIIDEFEPKGGIHESRWSDILSLIRLATSGGAERLRGTTSGASMATAPRFSAMLVSIHRPELSEADRSRLVPVKLSRATTVNWPKLKAEIDDAIEAKKMEELRSLIIVSAPEILERIEGVKSTMSDAGHDLGARDTVVYSALTAGAEWLSEGFYGTTFRKYAKDGVYETLKHVMTATIRRTGGMDTNIFELLDREMERLSGQTAHLTPDLLHEFYGFKIEYDGLSGKWTLMIAYEIPQINDLLRGSEWSKINMKDYLEQIPGVFEPQTSTGNRRRPRFRRQQRTALALGHESLRELGLIVDPDLYEKETRYGGDETTPIYNADDHLDPIATGGF